MGNFHGRCITGTLLKRKSGNAKAATRLQREDTSVIFQTGQVISHGCKHFKTSNVRSARITCFVTKDINILLAIDVDLRKRICVGFILLEQDTNEDCKDKGSLVQSCQIQLKTIRLFNERSRVSSGYKLNSYEMFMSLSFDR